MRRLIVAVALTLLFAAPAQAGIVADYSDFQSATNGIVRAPDGNYWVVEQNSDSVARMTPSGQVLQHSAVGSGPTSIAVDTEGTVWVSVTGADKLARFNSATGAKLADVPTGGQSNCGPVGLSSGVGNDKRMYMTLPNPDGNGCNAPSKIAAVAFDGSGLIAANASGPSYDLQIVGGKLFTTEQANGAVRRWTASSLTPEPGGAISAPNGPDGIVSDGTTVWVAQGNGTVAKFPVSQNSGSVQELTPAGGTLQFVAGITLGADGNVWVTGKDSKSLARVTPSGAYTFYAIGGDPWEIVNGPDGDFFITDQGSSRVRRFVSTVPRAAKPAVVAATATTASVTTTIDTRGNDTTVAFDYGPTVGYGNTVTTTVGALPPGPIATSAALTAALAPATTYHLRVRATNAEGVTTTDDTTFTTAAADGDGDGVAPPLDCDDKNAAIHPGAVDKPGDKIDQDCNGKDAAFPVLGARANFSWGFSGSRTALTKVTVSGLKGGETIKVTCKGSGCAFKTKTYKKVKKGTKKLTSLFGRKRLLKTGVKVEVRVTAKDQVGSSAKLTIGKAKKDPKIKRSRVNP